MNRMARPSIPVDLSAALAAAWVPIETAPRDGMPVLLWLAEDIDRYYVSGDRAPRITIGFWGKSNDDYSPGEAWHSVEAREEIWGMGGELTGPMTSTDCIAVVPTHWMPLPAPPKEPAQDHPGG